VGDGQIVGISVPTNAHTQTWTLTCRTDTTKFTVVGSIDGTFADATVGVPLCSLPGWLHDCGWPHHSIPKQAINSFSITVVPSGIFATSKAVQYTATTVFAGGGEDYINIDIPDNKNNKNLFGGDNSGGGITGGCSFYRGLRTSVPSAYLSAHLPGANPAPAYLGICHFLLRQVYIGTQTVVNDMSFAVAALPRSAGHSQSQHQRRRETRRG